MFDKVFTDKIFYKYFLSTRGSKFLDVTTSDITHIDMCGIDEVYIYLNLFTKDIIYQRKMRLKFLEMIYRNYKQENRNDKINTILND